MFLVFMVFLPKKRTYLHAMCRNRLNFDDEWLPSARCHEMERLHTVTACCDCHHRAQCQCYKPVAEILHAFVETSVCTQAYSLQAIFQSPHAMHLAY